MQRLVRLGYDLTEDVATAEKFPLAIVKDPYDILGNRVYSRENRRSRERTLDRSQCTGAEVDVRARVTGDDADLDRSHIAKIDSR